MHAPLNVTDRQLVCADYIRALQECHAKGFIKLMGGCNQVKKDLSMCLRKERIDRTTRNREQAKLRTAKKKDTWAALDREKELDLGVGVDGATSSTSGASGSTNTGPQKEDGSR